MSMSTLSNANLEEAAIENVDKAFDKYVLGHEELVKNVLGSDETVEDGAAHAQVKSGDEEAKGYVLVLIDAHDQKVCDVEFWDGFH
jgi:transcription antitermination factor NusG